MSLFLAVLTFFILIIVLLCIRENPYYLALVAFMSLFIAFNLPDLFNSGVAFTNTWYNYSGLTQQFWLQLMYGFLTLIAFGRAANNAYKNKMTVEGQ